MQQTIEAIVAGNMRYREAVVHYRIPKTTLERKVTKFKKATAEATTVPPVKCSLGPKTTIFSNEQEMNLVSYLKLMEASLFGLSTTDLRKLAFQLAQKNGNIHNFSNEKQMAGVDWMHEFMKRHPDLSLRKPEPTSAARAMGFNKVAVNSFFKLLGDLLDKHKFTADRIYNCDETGISTVSKSKSKVISARGRKQVGSLSSAERGQTVTVEICFNAVGMYMPPMLIFPRKRMNPKLLNGAFPGTWAECHQTGWMQSEIFVNWLKKIITFSHASQTNPVLLLLDGHTTHTKNLELIDLARANGVVMLCFPPHCTHRLQALDVAFMKPISTYYDAEVTSWLRSNPGRVVTNFQLAHLFGNAFIRAATITTAINGFRKTGVWPYNPNIFTDADFIAAETTNVHTPVVAELANLPTAVAEEATNITTALAAEPTIIPTVTATDQAVLSSKTNLERPPSPSRPGCSFWEKDSSGASSPFVVSPADIVPVPHLGNTNKKRTTRKRGKTAIITESPYKNELKEQQNNKKRILNKAKRVKRKIIMESPNSSDADENGTDTLKVHPRTSEPKIAKTRTRFKTSKMQQKLPNSTSSSSSGDEVDAECLYCGYLYSQSDEGWVLCIKCRKWAHCSCAGEDNENDEVQHICPKCQCN